MKVKDFLELIEAEDPYLILFNGYSGECLASFDFDREISGENLLSESFAFNIDNPSDYKQKMSSKGVRSGGSFMVFNKNRDFLDIFKNISDFFVSESCGICVPCRTGNFLLNKKIKKLILGHADHSDLKEIREWSTIIKRTSRCGLGQTSSNSLLCAMFKFPEEFEKRLTGDTNINRSFDLEKAVENYNDIIKEIETSYG
jgi:[NiFe] hydrogenase diaphorase moiety large subunit